MKELAEDLSRMGCEGLLPKFVELAEWGRLEETFVWEGKSVGEDYEARAGIMDRKSLGGSVWVCIAEKRGLGKPD